MTPSECIQVYEETEHTTFYSYYEDEEILAKITEECGYTTFNPIGIDLEIAETLVWCRW